VSASDAHSDCRNLVRLNGLEAPALCLGNALGGCGPATIALWVAAMIKTGPLSTSQVGWLASGELFAMAIGALAVSMYGKHGRPRWVAAIAALAIVTSNVIAMFPAVHLVIIGRLLSGLAMGALMASVTGVAARRQNAERLLALMQAGTVLLVSMIYLVSPILIGRFGPSGLFGILAVAGGVMMVAALLGLPAVVVALGVTRIAATQKLAPLLGCLALAVVLVGHSTVWTYIIAIGNGFGFDARTIGIVLAIAPPLALLGPVGAHILGQRVGLFWPLVADLALLTADILLLVNATSPILFCICTATLQMALMFCIPYAIALLGRLDTSGRFASAAPAFMMVGGAAGPALGSKMIGATGFHALALVAVSCIAVGIALFSVAAGLGAGFRWRRAVS